MIDQNGRRPTLPPVPWLAAGGVALALLAIVAGMTLGRGADDGRAGAVAEARRATGDASGAPVDSEATPRDVTGVTTDAATGATVARAAGTSTGSAGGSGPRRTPPLTWQQQVAADPEAPLRLTPLASDWAVEEIVIGKDLAGKFLGRVTVRYTGPGAASGKFEVSLRQDGKVLTTLVGEVEGEVRAGVYPVILTSRSAWVEGPWTTAFRVIATS